MYTKQLQVKGVIYEAFFVTVNEVTDPGISPIYLRRDGGWRLTTFRPIPVGSICVVEVSLLGVKIQYPLRKGNYRVYPRHISSFKPPFTVKYIPQAPPADVLNFFIFERV